MMSCRFIPLMYLPVLLLASCQPDSPPGVSEREVSTAVEPAERRATSQVPPDRFSQVIAQQRRLRQSIDQRGGGTVSGLSFPVPRPSQIVAEPYPEWTLEQTVIDSLGRIGEPAVPALTRMLRHPDPQRRQQAATILARVGPQAREAVPALVEALKDADPGVQKEAARALGQIGPAAAPAVGPLLHALEQASRDESQPP